MAHLHGSQLRTNALRKKNPTLPRVQTYARMRSYVNAGKKAILVGKKHKDTNTRRSAVAKPSMCSVEQRPASESVKEEMRLAKANAERR